MSPNLRRPADDLFMLLSKHLDAAISKLTRPFVNVLTNSGVQSICEKATGTWVDFLHAQDIVRTMVDLENRGISFNPEKQRFERYSTQDPHYQLKLLKMSRIGGLEPNFFKNINHTIPNLSRSLSTLRNDHCHFQNYEADQVLRAIDNAKQLLTALGDTEGAQRVDQLFTTYSTELGLSNPNEYIRPKLAPDVEKELAKEEEKAHTKEATKPASDAPSPTAEPKAKQLNEMLEDAKAGIIEIEDYRPWAVEPLGEPDHLNRLRARGHASRVRGAITEIVEAEAPISLDRLIRLTAYAFGIARLNKTMRDRIKRQILATEEIYIDDNKFVWISEENYTTYTIFRTDPDGYQRDINDISPRELANAIRYYRSNTPKPHAEEHRGVMVYFNRVRITSAVQKQIQAAYDEMGE